MNAARLFNLAWQASSWREAWTFRRGLGRVAQVQEALLRKLVERNRDTAFGRKHGFESIRNVADYRRNVPLATYEDLQPWVARVAAGEQAILTQEPVRLLEPTSGTTSGEKLIPYTDTLRRQFQRAVAVWIADLFRQRPGAARGRAYWSISPAVDRARHTAGGVRIGFEDDVEYLSRWEQWAVRRLLAVPSSVRHLPDIEAVRYATLLALLRAPDLALISVWSPTFLMALFAPLEEWHERLALDLARGAGDGAPEPRRAEELRSLFRQSRSPGERRQQLWPKLDVVSCWTHAAAGRYLPELRTLLPQADLQPKGLLATEGCVTLPLVGQPAPVLALRSGFFEFLPEAPRSDETRLAHQLEPGQRYEVVMTTGGGFYRYRLGDIVQVVGFLEQAPLLEFLGRADGTTDLVGEKLSERHVRAVLDKLFMERGLAPTFSLLVPLASPPRYRLYLQAETPQEVEPIAARLNELLKGNPHYRYALELGQLQAADVRWLSTQREAGWQIYERALAASGRKAGDIKPAALHGWHGWEAAFASSLASAPGETPAISQPA